MEPARKLTYMFMTLPYVHRLDIAEEIGTKPEGDNWVPVFLKAKAEKKLELMWDKVVCLLDDEPFHGQIMKLQANPFVGR